MSKTIDERVISMQFDNKHFESNVKTSMSTLDKLKQKLNFKDGSKGLENIGTAAKNVDMKSLSSSVENVRARFSALDVMGVTALANITTAAVNAGMRIVKALTLDPVMDGFREYEMTINAVQTTMAGTGKTAEEVEKELKRLDEYADKTVYSTADMLNNLPKFTNAGVDLEKATTAMIGIANATAHAGGDASKASIAFYNLGQAIGTGYLTRMDYNSINNAGIATMEWKKQMVDAAIAAGTLKKQGDDLYETGGKTFTMQQLFIEGLQHQWASTDVMLKVFSDYGDETTEIGKKAYSSAQDIKTFSMMMDSLKATAGTGWKDTWQHIFGGLDDAKVFWTGLTNFISNIITKVDDYRNTILDLAFNNPFTRMIDKIKEVTKSTKAAVEDVKDLTDIVNRVIRGDFGNQWDNGDRDYRRKLVEAAGYDYAEVQNAVNEKLGSSVRLTTKAAEGQKELNEQTAKGVDELLKMSDAELKKLGFTAEEIRMLRVLEEEAKNSGKTVDEILANMDKMSGREHLIEGFKNVGQGLAQVLKSIGKAWVEIFPPESAAIKLYNMMAGFHEFSKNLKMSDENADKLKRTFKGVFALIDIIATVIGGPIKIAFKLLGQILGAFDLNILDVTAAIGDSIVKFRDWLDSVLDFTGIFRKMVPHVKNAAAAIGDWFARMKDSSFIQNFGKHLRNAGESVKNFFTYLKNTSAFQTFWSFLKNTGSALVDWFKGMKEAESIPKYILQGLVNGLKNGASLVWDGITYLATGLISKFKELLGIHSPSVVFAAFGGFIIAGLVLGLTQGFPKLGETAQGMATSLGEFLSGVDWGAVFASVSSAIMLAMGYKLTDAVQNLTAPLAGIGDTLSGVGKVLRKSAKPIAQILDNTADVVKGFAKTMNAIAFNIATEGIKNIGIAVLMIAAAVVLISKFANPDTMWDAVIIVGVLASILAGLALAITKMDSAAVEINKSGVSIKGLRASLLSIGVAILLTALAAKLIGNMEPEKVEQGFIGLAGVVLALVAVLAAYGLFVKGKAAQNIDKAGKALRKIAVTMLLLILVAKLVSSMEPDEMVKAAQGMILLVGTVAAIMLATSLAGRNADKAGKAILKISVAMLLLLLIAKVIVKMPWEDMKKAGIGMLALVAFVGLLIAVTKLAGPNIDKVGKTLLAISGSVVILALVAKMIAGMTWGEMGKAGVGILALVGVIALLVLLVKSVEKDAPKIGATLLAISASIAILALVAALLSLLKPEALAKGIIAMGAIALIVTLMAKAAKDDKDISKTMTSLAIAIGVMAAAVAVLSFLDPAGVAIGTACMAALLGMIALIVKAASGSNIDKANVLMISIAAIMALFGLILRGVMKSKNGAEAAIATAGSLSLLMVAIAAVLFVISKVKVNLKDALVGALGMLALCVPLLALAGILSLMKGVKNAEQNSRALALLATVLSLLLIPLSAVGMLYAATGGTAALGIVGLLGMCASLLALVGVLALMQGVKDAEKSAMLLIKLMSALTLMSVALAVVGPFALIGAAAALALVGVITAVGVLVAAIGALMTACPQIEEFINKGLGLLIKLADGIGQMIGAFIGGLAEQLASSLPAIGTALSQFITNATPFINGVKMVDDAVLKGVGIMVAAILALTVADLINGVVTFLSGGKSFARLGTELSAFMENASGFIRDSANLDPRIASGVKTLADAILVLCSANMLDTVTKWLGGESSLSKFGTEIGKFGTALKTFVHNIGTFGDDQVKTVKCAGEAVKALADAADSIPATGGLWQRIVGEKSLAKFGTDFATLGTNLNTFVKNLGTFDDAKVATVKCAGEAVKALADAADSIPASDGLWQRIVGDKSLAKFGEDFKSLGTNLNSFVKNLGTFDEDKVKTVGCACDAVTKLAKAANSVPATNGLWQKIVGENSLAKFAGDLPELAKGVNGFVSNLNDMGEKATSVTAATSAIAALAGAADSCKQTTWDKLIGKESSLAALADQLPGLGESVSTFAASVTKGMTTDSATAVAGVGDILKAISIFAEDDAVGNADKLKKVAQDLRTYATDLASFAGTLAQFASGDYKKGSIDDLAEFFDKTIEKVGLILDTIKQFDADGGQEITKRLEEIGNTVKQFGQAVAIKWSETFNSGESAPKIKSGVDAMFTTAKNHIANTNNESRIAVLTATKEFGKAVAADFYTTEAGEKAQESGKKLVQDGFLKGIKDLIPAPGTVFALPRKLGESAAKSFASKKVITAAEKSGKNAVEGFVAGIENNTYLATNAGSALGKAALEAAKEALDENSPSKEMYKVGDFAGLGFVNALDDYADRAYKSGGNMADSARVGLSKAISKVVDMVEGGIDAQPTIRPVLDLSNVESGTSAIGRMLSGRRTLTVDTGLARVTAAAMAGYQNGGNSDVVSAIKGLRKDVSNMHGDTYTFGDFTYSGDTEIADAVQTLVRAVRVERRS